MTSPVIATLTNAGKWEVRINDERQKLLGTFEDTASRDLFIEAVTEIVMMNDEFLSAEGGRAAA